MKGILAIFSFFLILSSYGQRGLIPTEEDEKSDDVKHYNIIKIGSSIQAEPYSYGYSDYDYYGYYDYEYAYYDNGPNTQIFVSYEHIWELKNKLAFSIEPMLGAAFRKRHTGVFAGSEFKFYWVNTGNWRMGVSLYTAYSYSNGQRVQWVNMDDGSYRQRQEIQVNYNVFSFNSALIPFQFRIKNSPIVIESLFSWLGFNVINASYKRPINNEEYIKVRHSNIYPYFLKFELKVGFVLP